MEVLSDNLTRIDGVDIEGEIVSTRIKAGKGLITIRQTSDDYKLIKLKDQMLVSWTTKNEGGVVMPQFNDLSGLRTSDYQRETAKRNRTKARQHKEIEKYFRTVDIRLSDDRPKTWQEFEEAYSQAKRVRGNATTYYSLARHAYTNYDEICRYSTKRWGLFCQETSREILHTRVRALVAPYLHSLRVSAGVID